MSADNTATAIFERMAIAARQARPPVQRPPRPVRPVPSRIPIPDTLAWHPSIHNFFPPITPMEFLAAEESSVEQDLTNPGISKLPAAPVLPLLPPEPGLMIAGRYRLDQKLLKTTMSSIWKAIDLQTNQYVVIKFAEKTGNKAQEDTLIRALDNEGKVMGELPTVRDLDEDFPIRFPTFITQGWHGDRRFLVMSYIEGVQLSALIKEGMPLYRSIEIAMSLLYGFILMGRTGRIHRDVKAGNVIIDRQGYANLLDFAIAFKKGNRDTSGSLVGTFSCLAPEQIVGASLDQRVDIYALGILLYEMSTGNNPMRSWDHDLTIDRQLNDPLPALTPEQVEGRFTCPDSRLQEQATELRLKLNDIIQGMSEKMVEQRLGNITELIQRLEKLRDLAKELAPYETRLQSPANAMDNIDTVVQSTALLP